MFINSVLSLSGKAKLSMTSCNALVFLMVLLLIAFDYQFLSIHFLA